MNKTKINQFIIGLLFGITSIVINYPNYVNAQSTALNGGNKSTDFQPSTDNPQNIPNQNLQKTSNSLQPVPGNNGLTQQTLLNIESLSVEGVNDVNNPNTTTASSNVDEQKPYNYVPFYILSIVAIILGTYLGFKKPKKIQKTDEPKPKSISPEPMPTIKHKHKKSNKKKHSKKRKK